MSSADHHGHDRQHGHSHGHGHHGQSTAEANAEYFDKKVADYENIPGAKELMVRVGAVLRETGVFNKDKTTVLDFACGIGMVSRELRAVSKSIIGADISPGSVAEYNRRAAKLGATPEEMHAVELDLIKDGPAALGGNKFDVVVCSMAYHHFDRPEDFTRALAALLSPGGTLYVLDFSGEHPVNLKMEETIEKTIKHVVPHTHGFTADQMRVFYDDAGLSAFAVRNVARVPAPMPEEAAVQLTDEERMIEVFLAEGKKV